MAANPSPDAPTCPHCGCYLAADDRHPVCSPCRVSYRSRRLAGYRPQHDPGLRDRVLSVLQANRRRPVNLYRALGMWPAGPDEWRTVRVHVLYWGRRGHRVVGRHNGTYRYLGRR